VDYGSILVVNELILLYPSRLKLVRALHREHNRYKVLCTVRRVQNRPIGYDFDRAENALESYKQVSGGRVHKSQDKFFDNGYRRDAYYLCTQHSGL